MTETNEHSFYIGTYTDGESEGIYQCTLDNNGYFGVLALGAVAENPSYLLRSTNGKYLLSVNEIGSINNDGILESYLISDNKLILINRVPSGGSLPCFITTNNDGFILTANYSSGTVGLFQLKNDGSLSAPLDILEHSFPTEQNRIKHAHSAYFLGNQYDFISVDLGRNELWFSQIDKSSMCLKKNHSHVLKMNNDTGPRHLALHPNNQWIYIANENDSSITFVKIAHNTATIIETVSTINKNNKSPNTCADIHISSDGRFIYVSNRGHNTIALFQVDTINGNLKWLSSISSEGDGPRHFALSPNENFIVVANQHSDNLVSYKRNMVTGQLICISQINVPSPVCIVF